MSEKPSLTDYDSGDFSCIEEYEHWVTVNFTRLEAENEALRKLAFGDAVVDGS